MIKRTEQYQDLIPRLYPELFADADPDTLENAKTVRCRPITFQVTDECNLNCSYCYQHNKGKRVMSKETAKKFIDMLLDDDMTNGYINPEISPHVVLEFIGGEPFMAIDVIEFIVEYWKKRTIELNHPWATRYMLSICSNGVLYRHPRVQKFLQRNKNHLSFSVTLDGTKELHDSCRVFYDGTGSYDVAVDACKDWIARGGDMGSKITIAPGNITYVYEALVHMVELGYTEINANCVYEEGWTDEHGAELYRQMNRFSDYLIENNLEDEVYCSLYEENFFHPKEETDLQLWCGGDGMMLSCDPDGWLYPCIRFMESSLGDKVPAVRIGHVDTGIGKTEEFQKSIHCMDCITRRTMSNDECFYCPIAEGCSWCFREGTMITTPNGKVDIKDINVGDKVIAGNGSVQIVEGVSERYAHDTVAIRPVGRNSIYTTVEHPFWVSYGDDNGVWVNAGDIVAGNFVLVLDDPSDFTKGYWLEVESVDFNVGGYEVYNMSVANEHTYIADDVMVHNCAAYNYEVTGDLDSRATYICVMHKARSLANAYFWNKVYKKRGEDKRFEIHCPEEWAVPIIGLEEYTKLKEM